MNKNDTIHLLNIALIAISFIIAIIIPFELFLLAYAVLGPLHYFTEINWLKQNKFFVKNEQYVWILVALTLLASVPITVSVVFQLNEGNIIAHLSHYINRTYATIIFTALILSIGLVYGQNFSYFIVLLFISVAIIYLFRHTRIYYLLGGILLPSLIHVYVFTLFFMAYGVIKSKSLIGTLEILALMSIPLIIILLPINHGNYSLSNQTLMTFRESNFADLNFSLGNIIEADTSQYYESFLFSETGIKIQIFIAFAYVYHYLNWFSKVSLIGWLKNTSTKRILILILLWTISISFYFYDYRLGLGVLFFLSLLHVTLEFPLNVLSIKSVFNFAFNRIRSILIIK